MSRRITTKLPNPDGVAAGGTATFRIPVGRRIHNLYFLFAYNASTQNVSHFTEFRVYLNGQVIQRFSGVQRDTLNQYDRLPASSTAGILQIPFDRVRMLTLAGQEETAINTASLNEQTGLKISSVYMEVDIAGGATIGASDLTLYAEESDSVPGGPGTIPYLRNEIRSVAGADDDFQISDLVNPGVNAPDKVALARITFVPSSGALTRLRVDRNNYSVFDRTDALNRNIQNGGIRTAQSGYYSIDTGERGHGGNVIDLFGMTDFRYRLSASAAMDITCLSEYLGVLSG